MISVDIEDLKASEKRYNRMFQMLKDLEWIGRQGLKYCPSCKNFKRKGHLADCELDRLLFTIVEEDPTGTLVR